MCAILICTPSSLLKPQYAPIAETLFRTLLSLCVFPAGSAFGELGPSTAADGPEGAAPEAEVGASGQASMGSFTPVLAEMEECVDPCSTRDGRWLAQGRIQALLEVAIPSSLPFRPEMCRQRTSRTDLPHGCREPDLGRAADSWRAEDARF